MESDRDTVHQGKIKYILHLQKYEFLFICHIILLRFILCRLRTEICAFIQSNPNFLISETPLKDWVKWDSGSSVEEYIRKMSRGSWGGGIEMACFSIMKGVNVHVYERSGVGKNLDVLFVDK